MTNECSNCTYLDTVVGPYATWDLYLCTNCIGHKQSRYHTSPIKSGLVLYRPSKRRMTECYSYGQVKSTTWVPELQSAINRSMDKIDEFFQASDCPCRCIVTKPETTGGWR